MAGTTSIMCSYSMFSVSCLEGFSDLMSDLINGTYACENDKVMNDIVKREYGFRGCESTLKARFVMKY